MSLTGCVRSQEDQVAVDGLLNRGSIIFQEVEDALTATSASTLEEFVAENGLTLNDTRNAESGQLPWRIIAGEDRDAVEESFPDGGGLERENLLLDIDSDGVDTEGTLRLFVLSGYVESPTFDSNPAHYFYACLDLHVDVPGQDVEAFRAPCPEFPDPPTWASALPESDLGIGDRWPIKRPL